MSRIHSRLALAVSTAAIAALALSGCSSSDPISGGSETSAAPASDTIVIGSQAYYSNEIIAEIYAQALEGAGFTVERQFNIGQRDAYIPSLEDGTIQLFPEYTGNLLQFFDPDTTATSSDDVYAALKTALPEGLTVPTSRPRPTRTPTTSPPRSRRSTTSRASPTSPASRTSCSAAPPSSRRAPTARPA